MYPLQVLVGASLVTLADVRLEVLDLFFEESLDYLRPNPHGLFPGR